MAKYVKEKERADIDQFNEDIKNTGGYLYTNPQRISSRFSIRRMLKGIRETVNLEGKNVLDVGSGDGAVVLQLVDTGVRFILGVDPALSAVESANKCVDNLGISNVRFVHGSIDILDNNQQFDLVMFLNSIHHMGAPSSAIEKASKISDEIVILEPNGLNLILKIIEKTSKYHIEHKERSYTKNKILTWCADSGFKNYSYKYINLVPVFAPNWLAYLCKFLEPIIERIPVFRNFICGTIVIVASKDREN